MAITADQMSLILRNYPLLLRPAPGGGFICELVRDAQATRLHRGSLPTPEAAVEAAHLKILAAEAKAEEEKASRILALLEEGRFYIRPRMVPGIDTDGNPITTRVFDGFLPTNGPRQLTRATHAQAVIAMEALLG